MTIAESLKRFRKEFRLTQKSVADTLKISQQSYQVYEKDSVPSARIILELATKFSVSADYLLGLTDVPRPVPADRKLVAAIAACRDTIQEVLAQVDKEIADQQSPQPSQGAAQ